MTILRTTITYFIYFFIYCVFLLIVCSFIFFSIIEIEPGLLKTFNLDAVKYYAYKKRYRYDDKLVFRAKDRSDVKTIFNGDLYRKEYGIKPLKLPYAASYNDDGFRTNSSSPPYHVLFIGDSYLQIGENDQYTFSELFKTKSGLSTFNSGMAWYGPYQYLELFVQVIEKYVNVQEGQTQYAIFCFFSGNDIRDIKEYERWLDGGAYYKYLPQQNFLERYITAMSDILRVLFPDMLKRAIRSILRNPIDYKDDLGIINLADEQLPMRFAYWNEKHTAEQLLKNKEWKKLRELLKLEGMVARAALEFF